MIDKISPLVQYYTRVQDRHKRSITGAASAQGLDEAKLAHTRKVYHH